MKPIGILAIITICILLGGGIFYYQSSKLAPAGRDGMPLLDGFYWRGFDFNFDSLLIERDAAGELKVGGKPEWRIERTERGYVFLSQYHGYGWRKPQAKYTNPVTGKVDQVVELEIVPSKTTWGDWDLPSYWDNDGTPRELKYPIPVLHRMDDPRVREYMTKHQEFYRSTSGGGHSRQSFRQMAERLLADHPRDPYIRIIYMDSLLKARDMARLEACLEEWRPQFVAPSIPRLGFRLAEKALRQHKVIKAGQLARGVTALSNRKFAWPERLKNYTELLNYDTYLEGPWTLVESARPNFLMPQVDAKVMEVYSAFRLLEGRRTEALEYSASAYHLGQMLDNDATLITRVIGIALKGIGARAMQMHALNGIEDAAEGQALWTMLERLNRWETPPPDTERLLWYEPAGAQLSKAWWAEFPIARNIEEYQVRRGVAASKFQLTRLGAAARQRLLTTGALPAGGGELGPLLPKGAPADPFTSAPLRMAAAESGIVCYSVGPDRQDDGGAITYDPSNGTVSRGDVTLEVPRARKYPFPRGGVRARTKDELLAQFPNGLPPDPFADTRGKPLGVSEGFPVYVYSYGPDGDENVRSVTHPQAAYDPTNGTSSDGDLFIQIPER